MSVGTWGSIPHHDNLYSIQHGHCWLLQLLLVVVIVCCGCCLLWSLFVAFIALQLVTVLKHNGWHRKRPNSQNKSACCNNNCKLLTCIPLLAVEGHCNSTWAALTMTWASVVAACTVSEVAAWHTIAVHQICHGVPMVVISQLRWMLIYSPATTWHWTVHIAMLSKSNLKNSIPAAMMKCNIKSWNGLWQQVVMKWEGMERLCFWGERKTKQQHK